MAGPSDVPSGPERVSLSKLAGPLGPFRKPPTFDQAVIARLLLILLCVICVLTVGFPLIWWSTRPTVAQLQNLLGSSAQAKDVLEILSSLQRDHSEQFGDLFQRVIHSGLVPLFTLLAGYAFGSRQREKRQ